MATTFMRMRELRHLPSILTVYSCTHAIEKKETSIKDEVGVAMPKSTQTRFLGIRDNHNHYTSLHLLFEWDGDHK